MRKLSDYPFEIRPLTSEEGGGYLVSYPDFAECISDGETVDEALAHGKLVLNADTKLLRVFGKSQVTMFGLAGIVSKHRT